MPMSERIEDIEANAWVSPPERKEKMKPHTEP